MNIIRCFLILLILAPLSAAADIDGKWAVSGDYTSFTYSYIFKADGNRLTGEMAGSPTGMLQIQDGKIEGNTVYFTVPIEGVPFYCKGTIDGDTLTMSSGSDVNVERPVNTWILRRARLSHVDFPAVWSSPETVVVSMRQRPSDGTAPRTAGDNYGIYPQSFQNVQSELLKMKEVISVGVLTPLPFSFEAFYRSQSPMPMSKTLPIQSQGNSAVANRAVFGSASQGRDGFDILGVTFIAGRPFTADDIAKQLEQTERFRSSGGRLRPDGVAVIINEAAAQLLWPEKDVVGKVLYNYMGSSSTVVGVVKNSHLIPEPTEGNEFIPTVYAPFAGEGPNLRYELLVKLHPGASMNDFRDIAQKRLPDMAPHGLSVEIKVQPLSEYVKDAMEK